jgi:hypothetical protein
MSTRRFPRHTRVCRDAHVRRALGCLRTRPDIQDAFLGLLAVAHARSDLGQVAPGRDGALPYLDALVNLARYHWEATRDPYAWPGASGHPLAIVHSLAGHLLADYPVPRFLASVWFGANTMGERAQRSWFVHHGRGRAFRSLTLPLAMTRRMEHAFLRSPDHLGVDEALRRAEVLGMGGEPDLWAALRATPIGASFAGGERRREIIGWLVCRRDQLELGLVAPLVEHALAVPRPLAGRSVDAVWREHAARIAPPPRWVPPRRPVARVVVPERWPRSPWSGLAVVGEPGVVWSIVELCDREQLREEGRAMRHCVGGYAVHCGSGRSSIWSLRRDAGRGSESVLTIEVSPAQAAIVQLRGPHNRAPAGEALAIVRAWAAREGLGVDRRVDEDIARAAAFDRVEVPRAA